MMQCMKTKTWSEKRSDDAFALMDSLKASIATCLLALSDTC